jgi:hypothetical protein
LEFDAILISCSGGEAVRAKTRAGIIELNYVQCRAMVHDRDANGPGAAACEQNERCQAYSDK